MFMRSLTRTTECSLLMVTRITARPAGVMVHRASNSSLAHHLVQPNPYYVLPVTPKYNFARRIVSYPWRMLSTSSSSTPGQPDPGKQPKHSEDTPKKTTLESELKKVVSLQSQLTKIESRVGRHVATEPDKPLDIQSKKLGWMVSGTAIAVMSALFGKVYVLLGAVPLFLYHAKDLDILSKTFSRDTAFLWRYSKCWLLAKRIKNENMTLSKVFQQMEKKHPDKIMLQMHDQNWKYKDVASYANRTSRLMQKYGFQKGDVVAMFALNSPEMVAIVLGMANLGIITTLISTELRNKGLTQAIINSGCKGIIFDDELMHAFGDVYKSFDKSIIFQMRHKAKQPEFRVLEEELLKEYNDLPEVFINVHHDDPLLYMYSPNDTDYQEPMVITHEKYLFDSSAIAMMLDLRPSERIYIPTPLHETTGMILGIGPSITNSVSTVLKSKFSATDYFRECYVYNCNVGQYSGSMCKHLLLSPVSPIETFHPVRIMYGTGLESDYWQEFVNRFGTKMLEVHDASKDNINLMNMEGKVGVVGFRPKLAPSFLFPHYVIKVFGKDNIPVRTDKGLCQLCEYGEPGMLIKLWTDTGNLPPKVKTIQNIFKNGDMAITNGEILTIDESLYLRPLKKHLDKSWMNKLVTSEEVEYIASKLTSKRCAAYSLEMGYKQDIEILAIEDPRKQIDMKKFTDDLIDHLPRNWVPHYVRIVNKFEMLSSTKPTVDKKRLIDQGLNMEGDLVHYFDKNSMCYKPLMWAKGSRPQMLVTESKVQPMAESRSSENPPPSANTIISNVNKMAEKLKRLKAIETSIKTAKASATVVEKNIVAERNIKAKPSPVTPPVSKVKDDTTVQKTSSHATASTVQENKVKKESKPMEPSEQSSERLANLLKDFKFVSPVEKPESKLANKQKQQNEAKDFEERKIISTSPQIASNKISSESQAKPDTTERKFKSSSESDEKFAETDEGKFKICSESKTKSSADTNEKTLKASSESNAIKFSEIAEEKSKKSSESHAKSCDAIKFSPEWQSETDKREKEIKVETKVVSERKFKSSSESEAKFEEGDKGKFKDTSESQAKLSDKKERKIKPFSESQAQFSETDEGKIKDSSESQTKTFDKNEGKFKASSESKAKKYCYSEAAAEKAKISSDLQSKSQSNENKIKFSPESQAKSSETSEKTFSEPQKKASEKKIKASDSQEGYSYINKKKMESSSESPVKSSDKAEKELNVSSQWQGKHSDKAESKFKDSSDLQEKCSDKTERDCESIAEPVMNKVMKKRMNDHVEVKVPRAGKYIDSDETSLKNVCISKHSFEKSDSTELETKAGKTNVMEFKTDTEDHKVESKHLQQGESKDKKSTTEIVASQNRGVSDLKKSDDAEDSKSTSNLGFGPAEASKESKESKDKLDEEEAQIDSKKKKS